MFMSMKNVFRKINIKALLITIYTSIVWGIYIFLNCEQSSPILFTFLVISSYALSVSIFKKLDKLTISTSIKDKKSKLKVFIVVSIITFILMMIWLYAYYPGSYSLDSINQYIQAINGEYNDWHPALHTLLIFTLPLKLTGNIASIIVFQIIYFSLTMGYLAMTMYEIFGIKATVISCLYILLNPFVGYITLYPWKDTAFAITGLISTIISVRLIILKEKPFKIWQVILFGLVLASATIFRHNSILYIAPLLLVLFFNIDKKTWSKIILSFIIMFFLIKVPFYKAFNVAKSETEVVELTGLPLTVIGEVAKYDSESMDDELKEFAYSVATPEQWENEYYEGNFNSIKWSGINTAPVEEQGFGGMFKLMFKCFKESPVYSFRALFSLTDMVYGFEVGDEGYIDHRIVVNDYGIKDEGNSLLGGIIDSYSSLVMSSPLMIVKTYGLALLVVLFVAIYVLNFKSWESWKKIFMALPIFIYDFGTMLLLTGPDSRFFYITFLVTPLIVCYLLYFKGENYGK